MAVTQSHVSLKHINLAYPVTGSFKQLFMRDVLEAVVGGIIETDQRRRTVQIRALNDITLELERGSRTALIGNNGAGKSTLLRVIAGILHGNSGVRITTGKVVPLLDTNVGLDDESTAYENIFLRGLLLGLSGKELEEVLGYIIDLADLGEFLHLPLRTFSSGMRNRLAFAICTSVKPDILVVDEGFGAGDWDFMEKASRRFDKLLHGSESLILATHSETLMHRFCEQGIVMKKGSIIFQGPIKEAIQQYKESNLILP